jgi:hypothetical protein
MDKETVPVTVYVALGQMEANVVKSALESEGIPVVLRYESAGIVFGLSIDGLGEVRVQVPPEFETEAKEILAAAQEDEQPPAGDAPAA